MSAIHVTPAYPTFVDRDGQPLHLGSVYIGTAGQNPQSNPIAVFFDEALSVPAAQPLRTQSGYIVNGNSPARVFTAANDYSLTVRDRVGALVTSALSAVVALDADAIGEALYPQTSEETAASLTAVDFSIPSHDKCGYVNPWRYFSSAQLTSIKAYNFAQDVTTDLQRAMNLAWNVQVPIFVPGGGYLVDSGLTLPGEQLRRERGFIMRGAGAGEIFDFSNNGGTIIKRTTDGPVLTYTPDSPNTGNGQADISFIRWDADSDGANPAILFISFYDKSEFHHCNIYQRGTGGGLEIRLSNTIEIHHCYSINSDWATTTLGTARTGFGIKVTESIDTGLTTIRKCTTRGFEDGIILGDGVHRNFSNRIQDCEFSVLYNGLTMNAAVEGTSVDHCYFEGGDQGIGILDSGNYNSVTGCYIFPGYGTGIDSSSTTTYGSFYSYNVLSAGSVTGTKLVKLGGNSKGKACRNNTFAFSGSGGSVAGVVAITFSGSRPTFDTGGNMFDPSGGWTGGAGTAKYSDATTNAAVGYFNTDTAGLEFPVVRNGSRTNGRGSTLGDAAVASNVLTLPKLNSHTLTLTGAATINSISITDGSDDAIQVTIISTNANPTFADTASINMVGGANYTPGASGGQITFEVRSTGIAFEICRGSY